MKQLKNLSLSSLAILSLASCSTAEQPKRPNIILFLVDDMGIMDTSLPFVVGRNGEIERHPLNDFYRTPSMEALASQGVRLTSFYAQNMSSPTRVSLLTGQNSARHHVTTWINTDLNNRGDYGPQDWNWEGLKSDDQTLSRVLQEDGYRTIHIGKAHLGSTGSDGEFPQNLGFDINIAGSGIGMPASYYGEDGYGHIKGNKKRAVNDLEKYHGTSTFLTEALTLEANEQITKSVEDNTPFFLHLGHYAVHFPFNSDPRFESNYSDITHIGGRKVDDKIRSFATLIEGMDKSLGDIVTHLQKLGVAEDTLIIFMGDNGSDSPLGDEFGYTSSAPFRGKKATEYEAGARTVFIASWAELNEKNSNQKRLKIEPNTFENQISTAADIYPTILSVTNTPLPENYIVDGYDITSQLKGEIVDRDNSVLIHYPHQHRCSYFSSYIDNDRWKLIYNYNPEQGGKPSVRLYDLNQDPYESSDIAVENMVKVNTLIGEMSSQLESMNAQYVELKDGTKLRPQQIN